MGSCGSSDHRCRRQLVAAAHDTEDARCEDKDSDKGYEECMLCAGHDGPCKGVGNRCLPSTLETSNEVQCCAICLDRIAPTSLECGLMHPVRGMGVGRSRRQLLCGHAFHWECAEPWLQRN